MLILRAADFLFEIYWYILIARILLSWVPALHNTGFGEAIYRLSEPYLSLFRGFIPPISMGGAYLDLSPIVAFIVYSFLRVGAMSILQWGLQILGLL